MFHLQWWVDEVSYSSQPQRRSVSISWISNQFLEDTKPCCRFFSLLSQNPRWEPWRQRTRGAPNKTSRKSWFCGRTQQLSMISRLTNITRRLTWKNQLQHLRLKWSEHVNQPQNDQPLNLQLFVPRRRKWTAEARPEEVCSGVFDVLIWVFVLNLETLTHRKLYFGASGAKLGWGILLGVSGPRWCEILNCRMSMTTNKRVQEHFVKQTFKLGLSQPEGLLGFREKDLFCLAWSLPAREKLTLLSMAKVSHRTKPIQITFIRAGQIAQDSMVTFCTRRMHPSRKGFDFEKWPGTLFEHFIPKPDQDPRSPNPGGGGGQPKSLY